MGDMSRRLNIFDALTIKAREVMESRAAKYCKANINNREDANKNIRACEHAGICSATTGIMIRMYDKLARLANIGNDEFTDESVEDTVVDVINYAIILYDVFLEDKANTPVTT